MGIGGHMLGAHKLRQLNAMTGLNFDRAYNRNGLGGARLPHQDGSHDHYWVDFRTREVGVIEEPTHWWTCSHPEDS